MNNGSVESLDFYNDHINRQQQLQIICHHRPKSRDTTRIHTSVLNGSNKRGDHNGVKEVIETPPRKDNLVYINCSTTSDVVEVDESSRQEGIKTRSWLCCPGERDYDHAVPIQIEADDREENVSRRILKIMKKEQCKNRNVLIEN